MRQMYCQLFPGVYREVLGFGEVAIQKKAIARIAPGPLAQTLARETQIDPDLARVVTAWPDLPEAIRRAVLALATSTGG
jgi:hypothetical protein